MSLCNKLCSIELIVLIDVQNKYKRQRLNIIYLQLNLF